MIFNSIPFVVFFGLFFALYWMVASKKLIYQNSLILIGSYIFYAWIDWQFLAFLVFVSAFYYVLGINIENTTSNRRRKWLLYIGLIQSIVSLAYFKYFNFFISSFNALFQSLGLKVTAIQILIPLGISYFTFKAISYLLDVDKGKIEAVKDWRIFFIYMSFFPTILAGPIDKAKSFIPQLEKKRIFDNDQATGGLKQVLWGLFKKIVIADNVAIYADSVFENVGELPSSSLVLGAFLYTIQIYADFSGYSDMAIGLARLIGINVTRNFDTPLFAQNIAEFWRKWHMSLTSWLTEYVFTPLSISFRNYGKGGLIIAILINFVICGLWHGASWNYVLFGFMHGCYFIPLILRGTALFGKRKANGGHQVPSIKECLNIAGTFILVMFTFILFRADTAEYAFYYFINIFSKSLFEYPYLIEPGTGLHILPVKFLFVILLFLLVEWLGRRQEYTIADLGVKWRRPLRYAVYYMMILAILRYSGQDYQFIYFQF